MVIDLLFVRQCLVAVGGGVGCRWRPLLVVTMWVAAGDGGMVNMLVGGVISDMAGWRLGFFEMQWWLLDGDVSEQLYEPFEAFETALEGSPLETRDERSKCYVEKQAIGEVSSELLDTRVNPTVWEA
ncbi:hypothetical protein Tco_0447875 [Tanacetum coccineum]